MDRSPSVASAGMRKSDHLCLYVRSTPYGALATGHLYIVLIVRSRHGALPTRFVGLCNGTIAHNYPHYATCPSKAPFRGMGGDLNSVTLAIVCVTFFVLSDD